MPKVTKIEVQKKNKERFNLFLDGEFEMGIDIDTLVKFNLKKDQILEPSDMQNIQEYDHYRRGVNLAIQYLSYKKRTEREVIQYLEKNDIDHEDYAESLKNTMIHTTDKGPEIYRQKLYQLGIEVTIIEKYVEAYEQQQPLDDVIKVAEKVMKSKKGPEAKVKQKVTQSLLQKGYKFETIQLVMNEIDFSQDEETLDHLLQRDLEKVYNKNCRKYDSDKSVIKTIEALMRKGYNYDKIKSKLEESGISNE